MTIIDPTPSSVSAIVPAHMEVHSQVQRSKPIADKRTSLESICSVFCEVVKSCFQAWFPEYEAISLFKLSRDLNGHLKKMQRGEKPLDRACAQSEGKGARGLEGKVRIHTALLALDRIEKENIFSLRRNFLILPDVDLSRKIATLRASLLQFDRRGILYLFLFKNWFDA